jgi:hypothetical protein
MALYAIEYIPGIPFCKSRGSNRNGKMNSAVRIAFIRIDIPVSESFLQLSLCLHDLIHILAFDDYTININIAVILHLLPPKMK